MFTIGKAPDFGLTSVEFSLAKDTDALIIEGIPTPELIFAPQNRQSIFRLKVNIHCLARKQACLIAENAQSGQRLIAWSGKVL
jgi:hypothetical protein